MRHYEKPIVIFNNDIAEGVYMASGDNCYTVTANITQKPELGRPNYCVKMNASHNANHHATQQQVMISFNLPVTYVSSNATTIWGNGTNNLILIFEYHSNNVDNIGLGELYVSADEGLAILNVSANCNESCDWH
ncbi:MAG: hypothetical protein KBT03_04160 [Bacteroidales bacterium]|nr:hypothetical protein [Candidatus Scybalousia scybalohippi]